jgi:hypothetical protein
LILSHCSSVISCRLIIFKSMPEQLIRMVSVILTILYILQTPYSFRRFIFVYDTYPCLICVV